MTQSFPASFVGPTSKERKYDRQLRLWAASGQQALEDSHVLLINSDGPVDSDNAPVTGVVGVETLKNLILPGIGGFTIVDPAVVTEADLGVNFFLSEESLGKSRADETCKYLRELNTDVEGRFLDQPILDLLQNDELFLQLYRLVIVTGPIKQSTLATLSQHAKKLSIPLIYVRSVGFYSSFSLQLPDVFPVVETHPDPESTQDLRLTNPWPELAEAGRELANLDTLDDHQHGHVPYLLLLLHFLEKWKESHGGQYPQNYREKTEFRETVRAGARTSNPEDGEENFDEAVSAVLKSVGTWTLNSGLRDIFEMDQCCQVTATSENFWIIGNAVKAFYTNHGVLPLPGSLPDMKAQSSDYIRLQNIYKAKAGQDLAEVVATVRATENQLSAARPIPAIPEKEVEIFCKNAAHIKVIRGRDIPLLDLNSLPPQTVETLRSNLGNPESSAPILLALRGLDSLVSEYQAGKLSSTPDSPYLDDSESWKRAISEVLGTLQASDALDDESQAKVHTVAEEVRRAGAGELHNISSLTGGFVAQEALKVLTKQYVPLDNIFVFDGIKSSGEMFRL